MLFPTPGNLPNPGIEPASLAPPTLAGRFFTNAPSGHSLLLLPVGNLHCSLPSHTYSPSATSTATALWMSQTSILREEISELTLYGPLPQHDSFFIIGETWKSSLCYIPFGRLTSKFNPRCVYSVTSNSLQAHGLYLARLLCPWNFPGKNIGMGCHFLFQGIFLTQGLKQQLLHLLL